MSDLTAEAAIERYGLRCEPACPGRGWGSDCTCGAVATTRRFTIVPWSPEGIARRDVAYPETAA